jgi:hypothetical protein
VVAIDEHEPEIIIRRWTPSDPDGEVPDGQRPEVLARSRDRHHLDRVTEYGLAA